MFFRLSSLKWFLVLVVSLYQLDWLLCFGCNRIIWKTYRLVITFDCIFDPQINGLQYYSNCTDNNKITINENEQKQKKSMHANTTSIITEIINNQRQMSNDVQYMYIHWICFARFEFLFISCTYEFISHWRIQGLLSTLRGKERYTPNRYLKQRIGYCLELNNK